MSLSSGNTHGIRERIHRLFRSVSKGTEHHVSTGLQAKVSLFLVYSRQRHLSIEALVFQKVQED